METIDRWLSRSRLRQHLDNLAGLKTMGRSRHYRSVENLIIACDFLDDRGNPVGTRGTALRRIFAPGKTRISGVEFIRFALDLQGGACRTLSAKPAGSAQPNDME